jgi:chromosome segregation ATPase
LSDYLADIGDSTLVAYSREGEASNAVKSALNEIVTRRNAIAQTNAQILAATTSLDAIATDQDRIRKNMGSLDRASTLYKRYVSELDAQETRLAELKDQRDQLYKKLTQQQADLADYVEKLNLE